MTVLVGGVGQLYQGDLDVARVALERLAHGGLGPEVVLEDLSYGAVAVAQRLHELAPRKLVLVGAAARGRVPGTVERRPVSVIGLSPEQVQRAVADAVTGYVAIDLVVEVAHGLGALPARTIAIEIEPALTGPSVDLSPEGEAGVARAVELVREELGRP